MNPIFPPTFYQLPSEITHLVLHELEDADVINLRTVSHQWHDHPYLQRRWDGLRWATALLMTQCVPGLEIVRPPHIERFIKSPGGLIVEICMDGKVISKPIEELTSQPENEIKKNAFYQKRNAQIKESAVTVVSELKAFHEQLKRELEAILTNADLDLWATQVKRELTEQRDYQLAKVANQTLLEQEQIKSIIRIKQAILKQETMLMKLALCRNSAERKAILKNYIDHLPFARLLKEKVSNPFFTAFHQLDYFKKRYLEEYIALGHSSAGEKMAVYILKKQEKGLHQLTEHLTSEIRRDDGHTFRIKEALAEIRRSGLAIASLCFGEDLTAYSSKKLRALVRLCHYARTKIGI